MTYKMYGIPNCNTVKKARVALETKGIEYEFVDFKKMPPNKTLLKKWKSFFKDWPVNRKGPTFRKSKDAFEEASNDEKFNLMIENSSMIKRPILEKDNQVLVMGFNEEDYGKLK